jgi:hypothetical protein
MKARLARWGGGPQLLRGLLAFAFPLLLARLPHDIHYTAPLIAAGVFAYVAARWLVFAEPATLRDFGGIVRWHIAESVFVSVALAVALTVVHEALDLGRTASTVMVVGVIAYLFLHALGLPLLVLRSLRRQSQHSEEQPERPNLRRFIRAAAFVAGETVTLIAIGLAFDNHHEARRGPWGLWDVIPWVEILVLVVGYLPIVWLEMAATKSRTTEREEIDGAIEATLVQAAAVVVVALTGAAPWL